MSYRDEEFDLHITVHSWYYGDDWGADCSVRYPARGTQAAIEKDYDDENEGDAIEKTVKDIQAYLTDPDRWIANYIQASSDTRRKLLYAREQLDYHRQQAAYQQRDLAWNLENIEKYTEQIAALEAQEKASEQ